MTAVLGTNMASVWASKNLSSSQGAMATSVERLSSGLRINRARDDAAGLGIANALTQQINGANQGIRNLNDGISIVQTAEGAIAAASEMAQRILTLATQGANGSMNQDGRTSIANEMKQLLLSINAIATRTQFAGNTLLNVADAASVTGTKLSIAATHQSGDTIALTNTSFLNIGAKFIVAATASTGDGLGNLADTNLSITNPLSLTEAQLETYDFIYKLNTDGTYDTINLNKADAGASTIEIDAGNSVLWAVGDVLVLDKGQLSKDDSSDSSKSLLETIYHSHLTGSSGSDAATKFGELIVAAGDYITFLTKQRSELGALQNQMEYAVDNVTNLSSNLSSARSRVIDTDYAGETATLTKGQILQQAATAMLAQANQMPNVILSLLK